MSDTTKSQMAGRSFGMERGCLVLTAESVGPGLLSVGMLVEQSFPVEDINHQQCGEKTARRKEPRVTGEECRDEFHDATASARFSQAST